MAGFGGETRLTGPVGVAGLGAEEVVLVEPDRGALEDDVAVLVELLVGTFAFGVAVGVHQGGDGDAAEVLLAEGEVDRRSRREVDGAGDGRAVRGDVVTDVFGGEDVDAEDEDLRAAGGRFVFQGLLQVAVVEVVEEGPEVGVAAGFVHHADDSRILGEGDDDVPDVEGARRLRRPDAELVGAGRFLLAADDAADRTGQGVHHLSERVEEAVDVALRKARLVFDDGGVAVLAVAAAEADRLGVHVEQHRTALSFSEATASRGSRPPDSASGCVRGSGRGRGGSPSARRRWRGGCARPGARRRSRRSARSR